MLLTQSLLDSNFTNPIKLEETYTIRLVKNIIERDNIIDTFYIEDSVTIPIAYEDVKYSYNTTTNNKQVEIYNSIIDTVYPLNTIINIDGIHYKIIQYLSLVDTTSPKELLCLAVPDDVNLDVILDKHNEEYKNKIVVYMKNVLDYNADILKLAPSSVSLKQVYTKEYINTLEYNKLNDSLKINLYNKILQEIKYYGSYVPDNRFSSNYYKYKYCNKYIECALYSFIFWILSDQLLEYKYLYLPYVHLNNLTTIVDYDTKISLIQQGNNSRKFKIEPSYTTSYYEINIKDFSITPLDTTTNTYVINDLEIIMYNVDGTSSTVSVIGDTHYAKLTNFMLKIINNN